MDKNPHIEELTLNVITQEFTIDSIKAVRLADRINEWHQSKTKLLTEQFEDVKRQNLELQEQLENRRLDLLGATETINEQQDELDEYCYKTEGLEIHVKQLKEQLAEKEKELSDNVIKFAIWYSGMNENSVKKAYQRYIDEVVLKIK